MAGVTVVSLVPSATETLIALGVTPLACTRFCDQPGIPTVGGTKDPDIAAIVDLAPDLVVVNDEENRRLDAEALVAAGLGLHSMSPRSVAEVAPAIAALARAVGLREAVEIPEPPVSEPRRGRAVTLIWRRPWMSMSADTYGSSVLELLGWVNPTPAGARYPELTPDELAALAPDLVVLPDEPYPFGPRHVPEIAAVVPTARIVPVDGRDLFWWGVRTVDACARLAVALA